MIGQKCYDLMQHIGVNTVNPVGSQSSLYLQLYGKYFSHECLKMHFYLQSISGKNGQGKVSVTLLHLLLFQMTYFQLCDLNQIITKDFQTLA